MCLVNGGKNDPSATRNWTWLHCAAVTDWCSCKICISNGTQEYLLTRAFAPILPAWTRIEWFSTFRQVFYYIFCWLKKNGLRETLAYIIYLHSLFSLILTFMLTIEMERVALAKCAPHRDNLEDISQLCNVQTKTSFVSVVATIQNVLWSLSEWYSY